MCSSPGGVLPTPGVRDPQTPKTQKPKINLWGLDSSVGMVYPPFQTMLGLVFSVGVVLTPPKMLGLVFSVWVVLGK